MFYEFNKSPLWTLIRRGELSYYEGDVSLRPAANGRSKEEADAYNNSEENKNPYPFPTEREVSVIELKNGNVYRALFERKEKE
jgi:hypothetical protein